jgi:SAM-dependent methyltransferase
MQRTADGGRSLQRAGAAAHRSGMASFADHFSQLAARYAAYRPHYPPELTEALADRCTARHLAWDVGCGSGQLSVALATRFVRVIATDPSQAQLDHAAPHPRVEYRCEPAEASSLGDASVDERSDDGFAGGARGKAPRGVDLAVVAQAAHWFDWPRFVTEVGRVVRPGGLIALITYRNAEVDAAAGARLAGFYREIEPYWPNGRVHVLNQYRDLTLPWPEVTAPVIEMTARFRRDELIGYVSTWSATSRMVAANGSGALEALERDLAALWPDNEPREIRWPLTIKLARR